MRERQRREERAASEGRGRGGSGASPGITRGAGERQIGREEVVAWLRHAGHAAASGGGGEDDRGGCGGGLGQRAGPAAGKARLVSVLLFL